MRSELERLDREGLVQRAQAAGVKRARVLTRPELIDELLRHHDTTGDEAQLKRTRGFFGIARDLLSRVVERGLHLPDAADRLRAALGTPADVPRPAPQAVPTLTLAEIYAAQGHKQRAVDTLKRVLETEPDHVGARSLLADLEAKDYVPPPPPVLPDEERFDEFGAPDVEPGADPVSDRDVETPRVEDDVLLLVDPAPESLLSPDLPLSIATQCFAIPRPGAVFVWWRLANAHRASDHFFFVRAVAILPRWNGPDVRTQDVACDPEAGALVLRDLPDGAIVRVAIGRIEDGTFVPLAHSPAIETAGGELVEWTLEGSRPLDVRAPGSGLASALALAP